MANLLAVFRFPEYGTLAGLESLERVFVRYRGLVKACEPRILAPLGQESSASISSQALTFGFVADERRSECTKTTPLPPSG